MRASKMTRFRTAVAGLTAVAICSQTGVAPAAAEPAPMVSEQPRPLGLDPSVVGVTTALVGFAAIIAFASSQALGSDQTSGSQHLPATRDDSLQDLNDEFDTSGDYADRSAPLNPEIRVRGFSEDSIADVREELLADINLRRTQAGVAPLTVDAQLDRLAAAWSSGVAEMYAKQGSTAATTKLNAQLGERGFVSDWLSRNGLEDSAYTSEEQKAAANIWSSTATEAPSYVVAQWASARATESNLLNPEFHKVGVGVHRDPVTGEWFFTTFFIS